MASLNKVFLIGNLTRAPELRYTPSGTAVSDLRLAVNRAYTTQGGDRREETYFLTVVVWGKQAESSAQYLDKGSPVLVEEILSAARDVNADLIMMATHGHSALAQVVFGSVASRVVGSGVRPVLLVRPRELRGEKG